MTQSGYLNKSREKKSFLQWCYDNGTALIVVITIIGTIIGSFGYFAIFYDPLSEEQFMTLEKIATEVCTSGKLIEQPENIEISFNDNEVSVKYKYSSLSFKSQQQVIATLKDGELVMTRDYSRLSLVCYVIFGGACGACIAIAIYFPIFYISEKKFGSFF